MKDEQIAFLKEANNFFTQLITMLEERMKNLEHGAIGKSRFMNKWISEVMKANAQRSQLKIQQWIPVPTSFFWLVANKISGLFWKNNDESEVKILTKTMAYLSRAEEYMALQTPISSNAADFIPLAALTNIKKNAIELNQTLQNLLRQGSSLQIKTANRRTWFSHELLKGLQLIRVQVDAYGLATKSPFPKHYTLDEEKVENSRKRATEDLKEAVKAMPDEFSITTNTTQNKIYQDLLSQKYTPEHLAHFPRFRTLSTALQALESYTESHVNYDHKEVLDILKLNFPNPLKAKL